MRVSSKITRAILDKGYKRIQGRWMINHLNEWAARYFKEVSTGETVLVTVARSTGLWSVEVLKSNKTFQITDSTAL